MSYCDISLVIANVSRWEHQITGVSASSYQIIAFQYEIVVYSST